MKKLLYCLAGVLVFSLFCGTLGETQAQQAPSFHLPSLEGSLYTEENLIGHSILLFFWNSWCALCPTELPKISAFQERMKKTNFQVLAIAIADTEVNVRSYVTSHPTQFNFPVLYDAGDRVAIQYGVNRVPTFFLLNEKGELELAYQGEGLLEHPQFRATLGDLLNQGRLGWLTSEDHSGHVWQMKRRSPFDSLLSHRLN